MTTLYQEPTTRQPLSYGRQWISEADIAAVVEVLRSPWLTQGPAVQRFERRVAEYCGARHAVAVANGTAALHLAALASGLGPGDTGLTSPLTFLASANGIAYTGAAVDFVDASPATLCLDAEALEGRCATGQAPRLVVAVDYAGVPCDLPRLYALAQEYGFTLIEDAAHALGSAYRHDGRVYRCGGCAHAHLATLSFHPVKTITSGEGGMVLTNDDELAHRVRRLAGHGIERRAEHLTPEGVRGKPASLNRAATVRERSPSGVPTASLPARLTYEPSHMPSDRGPWYHEMRELGFNYRLSDIHAALGLSQMDRLDEWCQRRREIVTGYNEAFGGLADTPPWPEHTSPAFHLYVLRLRGGWRDHRRRFFERLTESGISPQVHYIPVHTQPYYRSRSGHVPGRFPVAEDTYHRCISLPLFPSLTDDDVSRVIQTVRAILSERV